MKMKKSVLAAGLVLSVSFAFTCGVFADSYLKKITAYQNSKISIKVDGQKVVLKDGKDTLTPIVYEGHTYVPAKPVAEAMGGSIKWDGASSTVFISSGSGSSVDPNAGIPNKDNSDDDNNSNNNSNDDDDDDKQAPIAGVKNTFASGTSAGDVFKEMKPVAKTALTYYLNAIKTGDTAKLKAFTDKYYTDMPLITDANKKFEYVSDSIEGYRKANKQDLIDGVIAAAQKKLDSGSFNPEYSSGSAEGKGVYVSYTLTSDTGSKYYFYFNVKFSFYNNGDGYKLTDIYFY
ncbi:copper amine oxidase N-terminal domain-containing protein [Paenibacillus spongiae]|uniref:Copper amine oxidase N-terminal domain-containing protein n=1 Tax=Paenibacillus spongiae TaxID=2909671 RepID=A0ABY5SE20_9BACL|nr:copper amine oxidase N-terminal domain-containing protein [Paenibacillus spongiae]UVI30523.1 copper amine oxidase N-terminal domain-containing protein [Paenibacillus spongiae]